MVNLFITLMSLITSFYSFSFESIDGDIIQMEKFRGKKVLLVNISTGSPKVSQLRQLQQLQDRYKDSLQVIAFPSNSFGTESRSAAEIKVYCQSIGVSFLIARPQFVSGPDASQIFKWLADESQNNVSTIEIRKDFFKILIDAQGEIAGIFAASVDPMDRLVQDAIISQ